MESEVETKARSRDARSRLAILLLLLALAAGLRFVGLSWGLRHRPHADERVIVENAAWMLQRGDLDHGYYEYPGLFFYLLTPVLALVEQPATGPDAYRAARTLVAAFGVLNVGLLYALGRRLASPWVGLVAAAFLAVSPVDVQTAHTVKADIVLQTLVLLGMFVLERVGRQAREDVLAGALLGAATAVKFSGVLFVLAYLVKRWLAAPRLPRALLAGAVSLATFVVLSPSSVMYFPQAVSGLMDQVGYHYKTTEASQESYWEMARGYAIVWPKALGVLGTALAAFGVISVVPRWRTWLPLAALPLGTVLFFGTSQYRFDRHMVPSMGLVALFAGCAVMLLARYSRAAAGVVCLVALALPLRSTLDYLGVITGSSTRDQVVDWISAHVPDGARILTTDFAIGLDRSRFEVLEARQLGGPRLAQILEMDLIVTRPGRVDKRLRGVLRTLYLPEIPADPRGGLPLEVFAPGSDARLWFRPVPLDVAADAAAADPEDVGDAETARVSASAAPELLPALCDADPATAWQAPGPQVPGTWVQVDWPWPVTVGVVELKLGGHARHYAANLHVLVDREGEWQRVRVFQGRPPVRNQMGRDRSQKLILERPARTRALRIVQVGRRWRPWRIAELDVHALL